MNGNAILLLFYDFLETEGMIGLKKNDNIDNYIDRWYGIYY